MKLFLLRIRTTSTEMLDGEKIMFETSVSTQSFCLLVVAWNQSYTFVVFRYSVIVLQHF